MLLQIYRQWVLSDSDAGCRKYGLPPFVEVSNLQVPSDNSDNIGSNEVKAAVVSLGQSLDAFQSIKNVDRWHCPPGIFPSQLFPLNVPHFVSSDHKSYPLFCNFSTVPSTRWSSELQQNFNHMDPEILQPHDFGDFMCKVVRYQLQAIRCWWGYQSPLDEPSEFTLFHSALCVWSTMLAIHPTSLVVKRTQNRKKVSTSTYEKYI